MAMLFVCLFAVLALSFTAMSNTNMQTAVSQRDIAGAQAAAESGLAYGHNLVTTYIMGDAFKTINNVVAPAGAKGVVEAFALFARDELNGLAPLQGVTVPRATTSTTGTTTITEFTIPDIVFSSDSKTSFSLHVSHDSAAPGILSVLCTGTQADITRTVRMDYAMAKDTSMIDFAIASKSPVTITDNTNIGVGIYTDWEALDIAAPVTLAGVAAINGNISTTLSEGDFDDAGYAFPDQLPGTYGQIQYSQPKLDLPSAEDFDTSSYADGTKVLNAGHTYKVTEYYPHAPGDYTTPVYGSFALTRTVYENRIITDSRSIAGNALFINCTFNGTFYVGTTDGIGTNNVRFENCTFNAPIVTGVPPKFGPEDWKKNVLYFTGETAFNNIVMEEATILAPNYNVDIGAIGSSSTLTGLVLGGVVDIRGNATIDGTIVSMADPLELGYYAGQIDTTIGISDSGGNTISITPTPQRLLPIGINTKILLIRDGSSYNEL